MSTATATVYEQSTTTTPLGQVTDYVRQSEKWEAKTHVTDTVVLVGFGVGLKVVQDALTIRHGFTHSTSQLPSQQVLYRGIHGIKQLVILSDSGNVSLDAIKWCKDEHITITMINGDGSLQQTLTPEQVANANLRRKQYSVDPAYISYRLICKKTQAQLDLLEKHSELPDRTRAQEIFSDSLKWLELPDLPRWQDLDYMRTFEGRLAKAYFEALECIAIRFEKSYSKQVPPHWKSITTRTSPLSHNHGARHAVNPFHALLNYAYAVCESQVRQALTCAGFDVACGFLHSDKLYRDSLVYDLIELFRPLVDALVLKLIATTAFKKGDFIPVHDGSVRLNDHLSRFLVVTCKVGQTEIDAGVKWLKTLLYGLSAN